MCVYLCMLSSPMFVCTINQQNVCKKCKNNNKHNLNCCHCQIKTVIKKITQQQQQFVDNVADVDAAAAVAATDDDHAA